MSSRGWLHFDDLPYRIVRVKVYSAFRQAPQDRDIDDMHIIVMAKHRVAVDSTDSDDSLF